MTVYCIRSECGAVKIGVAKDVQRRLDNLQIGSPLGLEIVGVIPGDETLERELHERFAARRTRGEWFNDSDGAISGAFGPYVPAAKPMRGVGPLAEYLHRTGQKQIDFARTIGTNQSHLSSLVSGTRRPSLRLAHRIEQATDGAVPIISWATHDEGDAA